MITFETIAVIIISIVLIVIVLVLYFSRRSIFPPNTSTYGTFESVSLSGCQPTASGCNETGYQTQTEICHPNPSTSKGCLDSNGNQTFGLRLTQIPCTPICYSSAWETTEGETCIPVDENGNLVPLNEDGDLPAGLCIDSTTIGYTIGTAKCVAHDNDGVNTCIWDVDTSIPLPAGCKLDFGGLTATCLVGSIVPTRTRCIPSKFLTRCGVYGVQTTNNSSETPITTVIPCSTDAKASYTKECYRFFQTGDFGPRIKTNIEEIYTSGWTFEPIECYDHYDTNGTDPPGLATCHSYTGDTELKDIETALTSGDSVSYLFGAQPVCVQPCIYYDADPFYDVLNWVDDLRNLVYYPWVFGFGADTWFLALHNIPQSTNIQDSLVEGLQYDPNPSLFADTFGDPRKPVDETPCVFFSPDIIILNLESYHLREDTCGGSSDYTNHKVSILDTAALVCFFHPISATRTLSGTIEAKGYIIGFQGRDYRGTLYVKTSSSPRKLVWIQGDPKIPAPSGYRNDFTLIYTPGLGPNPATIVLQYYLPSDPPSVNFPPIPTTQGGTIDITGLPLNIKLLPDVTYYDSTHTEVTKSPIDLLNHTIRWEDFYSIMNQRQTRHNPYGCNPFYTYPPPEGFPSDTSDTNVRV